MISALHALLLDQYGLSGELTELYSYQDHSFVLDTRHDKTDSAGAQYVVKVMHIGATAASVDVQVELLDALHARATEEHTPGQASYARVVRTQHGSAQAMLELSPSATHRVWVVSWLDGSLAADQQPLRPDTMKHLGKTIAHMHGTLKSVRSDHLEREFSWKLGSAEWLDEHRDALQAAYPEHGEWLKSAIDTFLDRSGEQTGKQALAELEHQAIHGDLNEHNVLLAPLDSFDPLAAPPVNGIIDFGDAHLAPRVVDLAIAATYFMMNQSNPWLILEALLRGYHAVMPLSDQEQSLLMPLVQLRLAQSLTQSMLRAAVDPDNAYLTVSQQPALKLITQLKAYRPGFATHWVRWSCDHPGMEHKHQRLLAAIARERPSEVLNTPLDDADLLDLSPGSGTPANPFSGDMPQPDTSISAQARPAIALGKYGEPRLVYQSAEFKQGHPAQDARTIHMGVDVFAVAGTSVHAPLAGTVHAIENRTARQDYGPVIVLEHALKDDVFYTLYGHLDSECLKRLKPGQTVERGERIALIGAPPENGDWPPHLHFQWVLENFNWGTDINGVCHRFDWPAWTQVCPNPAPLLGIAEATVAHRVEPDEELQARRNRTLGASLAVSYAQPVQAVRGWQQFLFDPYGRCFLDAYNNVPHVGHCHPHVVEAVSRQLSTLSTNTRYLHSTILDYADALTAHFDDSLSVCFVVNSASEANELALRLARTATGAKDMIVMADAYHGHTTSLIDISPYKAEGHGGEGCPAWVHQLPAVDLYRGTYRYDDPDAARKYADDAAQLITGLEQPLCAFMCESLPSVGGQLVYPPGYLKRVYASVRAAGGVCIADEVQTGFGRTGEHFWGFEQQEVVPDMVVLGKPIGNGFPLAAVITTQKIADRFNTGMEFFSTFGGNTVACAAGLAVLEVVEKEQVQRHIKQVGAHLVDRLRQHIGDHPLVGDIRGMGLFLGIELVTCRSKLTPATPHAAYVKNRLREEGVLIGTDGPHDNVLKIRPPAPFNDEDADFFVNRLAHVLNDTRLRA